MVILHHKLYTVSVYMFKNTSIRQQSIRLVEFQVHHPNPGWHIHLFYIDTIVCYFTIVNYYNIHIVCNAIRTYISININIIFCEQLIYHNHNYYTVLFLPLISFHSYFLLFGLISISYNNYIQPSKIINNKNI